MVKANGYGHGCGAGCAGRARRRCLVARAWRGSRRACTCATAGITAPIMLLSEPAPAPPRRWSTRDHAGRLHRDRDRRPGEGRRRRGRRAARRAPEDRHRHAPRWVAGRRRRCACRAGRGARRAGAGRACAPTSRWPTTRPIPTPSSSSPASTPCSPRSTVPGCGRRSCTRPTRPGCSPAPAAATTSCGSGIALLRPAAGPRRSPATRASQLRPALSLRARITMVKDLPEGARMSVRPALRDDARPAGWRRSPPGMPTACRATSAWSGGEVLVRGQRRPIAGRDHDGPAHGRSRRSPRRTRRRGGAHRPSGRRRDHGHGMGARSWAPSPTRSSPGSARGCPARTEVSGR